MRGEMDPKVVRNLPVPEDSTILDEVMEKGLAVLHQHGYLLAQIASSDSARIVVYPGKQFRWAELSSGNLPGEIIRRTKFQPGRYSTLPFEQGKLEALFNRILMASENTGYPFASVRLDSIMIVNETVHAALRYDNGPYIVYDSVRITGDARIKPAWFQVYLDIIPGQPYDHRHVERLSSKIDRLPFVRETAPVAWRFHNGRAEPEIYLERVASNRVDGIVGFLPNEGEGLRITGQAELELNNLFYSGKSFRMFWQRMRPETQLLQLSYNHTNLLRTPLGVGLSFNLLKEDSTFINREFNITMNYSEGPHEIFFLSRIKAARLLDTSPYEDAVDLPEIADFNLNDYGAGYRYYDIRAGWLGQWGMKFRGEAALGNKKIRPNAGLPAEVYEGISLSSLQSRADFSFHWGFRIGRQSLLVQRWSGGWMKGDNLFMNDLYRLGGFRTIRGFNENEFFARYFGLLSLEWQMFIGASSNIMVFLDQAWFKDFSGSDNPTGIGIGSTLQTGAGLLQLAYAVGRTNQNPFDFRKSKFHFGYIARF